MKYILILFCLEILNLGWAADSTAFPTYWTNNLVRGENLQIITSLTTDADIPTIYSTTFPTTFSSAPQLVYGMS